MGFPEENGYDKGNRELYKKIDARYNESYDVWGEVTDIAIPFGP
jgi:hypothetical protein